MKNLPKNYARALFEISEEENIGEEIFDEFRVVSKIFKNNPDYIKLLQCCKVGKDEKITLLDRAFGHKINDFILNFLKVIVQNHHANILKSCFLEFEKIYNEKNGILEVRVHSSVPLTQDQVKKLTLKLEKKTQKKIIISNKIDPAIIGGIKIFCKETTFDVSLESYFKKLYKSLEVSGLELQ